MIDDMFYEVVCFFNIGVEVVIWVVLVESKGVDVEI